MGAWTALIVQRMPVEAGDGWAADHLLVAVALGPGRSARSVAGFVPTANPYGAAAWTQRSQHSVRAIEGVDSTRAGALDLRAEGRATIQASHALVNGKDLVKMDGGQIHLG